MGASASGGFYFNMKEPEMATQDRQARIDRVKENHIELLRLVYRDFFQLSQDGNCDDLAFLINTMGHIIRSAQQMIIDSKKCIDCQHLDCSAAGTGDGVVDES
ncbi:hypothetical protein LCGC14_2736230 [marine sediment metagenome]|uniref:Uncharacterized protein n=1 Tax=marine sediment metagenome TaxID=412755 RepID=A0A0F9BEP3_9ZZZZ|nr:hypothetical protein [Desulfobacterales bacterium]